MTIFPAHAIVLLIVRSREETRMRVLPKPRSTSRKVFLPDPLVIGRLRYWRRGAIRQYLAEIEGKAAPDPQADDEHLIQAQELRQWLGGVSDMWLFRNSRRANGHELATA